MSQTNQNIFVFLSSLNHIKTFIHCENIMSKLVLAFSYKIDKKLEWNLTRGNQDNPSTQANILISPTS